jgi:hypothetical protein
MVSSPLPVGERSDGVAIRVRGRSAIDRPVFPRPIPLPNRGRTACASMPLIITQLLMRASATAFWNSAVMASEMPCVGLTSKYRPGEAQFCMLVAISLFGDGP